MEINKSLKGESLLPIIKNKEKELREKVERVKEEMKLKIEEERVFWDKELLKFKENIGQIYEEKYREGEEKIKEEAFREEEEIKEEIKRLEIKYQKLIPKLTQIIFKKMFNIE